MLQELQDFNEEYSEEPSAEGQQILKVEGYK